MLNQYAEEIELKYISNLISQLGPQTGKVSKWFHSLSLVAALPTNVLQSDSSPFTGNNRKRKFIVIRIDFGNMIFSVKYCN